MASFDSVAVHRRPNRIASGTKLGVTFLVRESEFFEITRFDGSTSALAANHLLPLRSVSGSDL